MLISINQYRFTESEHTCCSSDVNMLVGDRQSTLVTQWSSQRAGRHWARISVQAPTQRTLLAVADSDIPKGGGGGGVHEMRLNANGTAGSFGGRKLIYNKIITHKIYGEGSGSLAPLDSPLVGVWTLLHILPQ